MTKWKHKVDLGWLMARQECLTATDVKDLLPITKTGRKRTVGDDAYIGVLAKKLCTLTEDDCVSTGAAARGHILEPHAVNMYNMQVAEFMQEDKLFHWDDIIVTRKPFVKWSLGFSPDALDIQMPSCDIACLAVDGVTRVGEVKSYYPNKHLVCANTPKMELEERWQIAVAMAVCPSIEEGTLLFYNPSMPKDMLYIVDYTRQDLVNEIEMVLEVEKNWLEFIADYEPMHEKFVGGPVEEEIVRDIMRREELNPEDEKTVMR